LPAGLNFGTSNGTIWGIPTVSQAMATTYTIWANNSGGSTSATITITINDEPPGPFEYIPENNTWTNNSYVNIGPSFINETSGNGSTWTLTNFRSLSPGWMGNNMYFLVGDTFYFDAYSASTGLELWAHNLSNGTTWQVADISSAYSSSPGRSMAVLVGDTIYFGASDGIKGEELWAHNASNHSTWLVADIRSGFSSSYPNDALLVGDTIYFSANDGTTGEELWAHDTSNHSTWQVANINTNPTASSQPGLWLLMVIGDTLYFSADDGSTGHELWAHDTSNSTTWQVADINSGSGDGLVSIESIGPLVGDTIYFSANDGSTGQELWAHNTTNATTWQVADVRSGSVGSNLQRGTLLGDTVYFSARDAIYGPQMWAHDTSNRSTWRVTAITGNGSNVGAPLKVVGDTIFFRATDGSTGYEFWAHDTSNSTTWQVADVNNGSNGSNPSIETSILIDDTLYFRAVVLNGRADLCAYNLSSINYQTNTGGNVTTWAINASLPSGLSFGTNNGTIYGTPTELWTQTSYMVWANNSGGSSVAYLNITVVEELANISYNPSTVTIVRGYTMANVSASNTGGDVISWGITPALPSGLSFDNGTIYGRPLSNMSATTFTIYANNSGGSATATLTLTINEPTPNIDYSPDNYTMTN
ncbi:MAG: putative Ig domain-containing protein, partial [Candidatus Thermoplasmatota archaeon]|nr:putative Ig domain-containing protein [Candidatus Thermoplasmatota archaeon]